MKRLILIFLCATTSYALPPTCETGDCWINPTPLYGQHNLAFPNNGRYFCAPTTGAMMIQSQLNKPGVTVITGSWTYNNFPPLYTTQVLAEATEMATNPFSGTCGCTVYLGFMHPIVDVLNSDGTQSVFEQSPDYPSQRSLDDYKSKLGQGYAIGVLIDYEREKRVYDGYPSCNITRYEYRKNGGHFVALTGFDGNDFFINNPLQPSYEKKRFGIMPHWKNGKPVRVYLENGYRVPDSMNLNYIGAIANRTLHYPCPPNDTNCLCDQSRGVTTTPVYTSIPGDYLYRAY